MTRKPSTTARVIDLLLEASVVGSFSRIGFSTRARIFGWQDPLGGVVSRRVLITGANSGLGFALTASLLRHGAHVTATTRSPAKSARMRTQLDAALGFSVGDRLVTDELDLHDLAAVRAFGLRHADTNLDTLIHNAGALHHTFAHTVDGIERTVQAHVLAPFVLTTLLRGTLERSGDGRVITVTSGGLYTTPLASGLFERSADNFNGTRMYAEAKRAQLVLTHQWQRRFGSDTLTFFATHPGWVDTPGLASSLPEFSGRLGPLLRDPVMGVDTILYLTTAPVTPVRNRLWHDRLPRRQHRLLHTFTRRGLAGQLWADACSTAGVTPYSDAT